MSECLSHGNPIDCHHAHTGLRGVFDFGGSESLIALRNVIVIAVAPVVLDTGVGAQPEGGDGVERTAGVGSVITVALTVAGVGVTRIIVIDGVVYRTSVILWSVINGVHLYRWWWPGPDLTGISSVGPRYVTLNS